MAAPNYNDIFRAGVRALAIRPSPFSKDVAEASESTANIVCHVNASMAEETAVFADAKLAEIQLATAVQLGGAVLDRLAYDRYGEDLEPRKTATIAVAELAIRRTGTVALVVPRDSRVATGDGIVFRTASDLLFPEGVKGPLKVFSYCTVAGPDGNVSESTITSVLDQPADDPTLSATNAARAAGGHPEEEPGEFASRMRGFWLAARKATKTAVEYAALSTDGVASVLAEEVVNPLDPLIPTYRATLTIADRYGNANAALAARVRDGLSETRALGVPIAVFGSTPIYISIALTGLAFRQGQDTAGNRAAIREAIVADLAANQATGAQFSRAAVIATLHRYVGKDKPLAFVPLDVVTSPATDQPAPSKQVAYRTRPELILINGT
jgi:hypothetical protein